MSRNTRNRLIVVGLVALVALAVRLDYALLAPEMTGRRAVGDFHDVIGVNLVTGHGFSYQAGVSEPTVARAPLFPVVLGATYALAGNERPWTLWRVMDAVVDSGTAVLLTFFVLATTRLRLGRRGGDRGDEPPSDARPTQGSLWLAGTAGLLYALNPIPARLAAMLTPETWLTFWTVLAALAFVGWLRRPTYRRAALTGVALGLLILTKGVGLGLPVLAAAPGVLLLRRAGSRSRSTLFGGLLIAAVAYGLVVPWTVRNYLVSDSFIPVQTMTWYNFWIDWTVDDPPPAVDPFPLSGGPYPLPTHLTTPHQDVVREAWLRDQALAWIRHNPRAFLGKIAGNLLQAWYYTPGAPRQLTGPVLIYLAQVALALAGAAIGLAGTRLRLLAGLCLSVTAYYVLLYAPFMAHVRLALPVVPFIAALAAVPVVAVATPVWRTARRRSSRLSGARRLDH